LAQGPDGSLYVSADAKGAIYKISYGKSSNPAAAVDSSKVLVKKPAVKKMLTQIPASIKTAYNAGAIVYAKSCATCHMDDGRGVQDMNAPLIGTSYVMGNKTRLINVLLKGLNGVAIDGEKYSNVMPSHSFLTDKQIADVLTYVRNSFGNKATPITEKDVTATRIATNSLKR
jgi:mono/diheme cytochrome c family protein